MMLRKAFTIGLLGLFVGSFLLLRAAPASSKRLWGPPVAVWCVTYHSVNDNKDAWGRFVVSPEEFESDLRYLQENGFHSVLPADLSAYVQKGTPLPDKPVLITFDDGYRDNYSVVFPLLKKYEMKAVVSLIGELIDRVDEKNAERGMLSWPEAREMADSGLVELANHTYALHHATEKRFGITKRAAESLADYQALLTSDLVRCQRRITEKTGHTPVAFVYPFGGVSEMSTPVLEKTGFSLTLTTEHGGNTIGLHNMNCLYGLRRNSRPHGISSEDFFKGIEMT